MSYINNEGCSDELDAVLKPSRLEVDGIAMVRSTALPALDEACGAITRIETLLPVVRLRRRLGYQTCRCRLTLIMRYMTWRYTL